MHARLKRNPPAVVLERSERERLLRTHGGYLPGVLVLVLLYCCETHSRRLPFSCRQVLPGFWWARPAGF